MTGITPVSSASSAPAPEASTTSSDAKLADAFAQGIVQFMGLVIQNAVADVQDAANDTTSDPDAPS